MIIENNQNPISILVNGVPGAGKSTILNTLLTMNPDAQIFKSGNIVQSGLTKNITSKQGHLFGDATKKLIKVYDLPGIGDENIGPEQLVNEFQQKIGEGSSIDIALIVVKATDQRMTVQQKCAIAVLKNFLTQIEPKSIIWVFSWVDEYNPDKKYVEEKIQSYNLGFNLLKDNIIYYTKKNPQTIRPIENLLVKTDMKIANNLLLASQNILQEMSQWSDVPNKEISQILQMMVQNSQDLNNRMIIQLQEMSQQAIQQQDQQTQMMLNQMEQQLKQQQEIFQQSQQQFQQQQFGNSQQQLKQQQDFQRFQAELLQNQMQQTANISQQLAQQPAKKNNKLGLMDIVGIGLPLIEVFGSSSCSIF